MNKPTPKELEPKVVEEFGKQRKPVPEADALRVVTGAGYLRRNAGVWPLPEDWLENGLVHLFVAAHASRPTLDYGQRGTCRE